MATINAVGNGLTGVTGSGAFVGATSPTLVTPNLGTPSDIDLENATFPATIDSDISGNAATATLADEATALATARAIYGNDFDGTAALDQIIAATYGGTGNGFTQFSGATTSTKTYTLPNASCNVLTDNAAVTVAQGGTGITTTTAYGLLTGGTTATGAFQNAGTGTAGQIYVSGGASALGTWTTTNAQQNTAWTPADGSGAGISFSGVSAEYSRYFNMVNFQATLTYGSTANTDPAVISGLPANAHAVYISSVFSAAGVAIIAKTAGSADTLALFNAVTGAAIQNATLSTLEITISGSYCV